MFLNGSFEFINNGMLFLNNAGSNVMMLCGFFVFNVKLTLVSVEEACKFWCCQKKSLSGVCVV
jgi:hypothetical protein